MEIKDERLFRITPVQQMAAACSGALLTSLMGKSISFNKDDMIFIDRKK